MARAVGQKEFSMQIDKEKSDLIWRLKGIAIFTVFFAHVPYNGSCEWINYGYNLLGMLGVPAFLVLSGYFDFKSSTTLNKTAKSLFFPVLIWGLLSYVLAHYLTIKSIHHQLVDIFKWLYGCGSWLYFVPVLFWCKILSHLFSRYTRLLFAFSLISIYMTCEDIVPYNEYFTPYTNPFNFYVYFQIGRVIRQKNISFSSDKLLVVSLIVFPASLYLWGGQIPSYFSLYSVVVSLCAFVILYRIAAWLRHGEEVGRLSYVIYLFHLVPASIINRKGQLLFGEWFDYVKVPIIFVLIVAFVWLGKKLLKKMGLERFNNCFGYR